ncbi:MAG: hypothetical protein K2J61_02880 [Clostridia bacterium]|nr:hypothetical protein [Clostridia bacterium]
MKKGLIKILSAVALLAAALPCAVSPVLANSGPREERGETASGTIVRNKNSVLAVESEKLTFDIVDFPPHGENVDYNSTVTAEYKFVNTSPNTVHTSMAFPMKAGERYCYGDQEFAPVISVNGQQIDCVTRYTTAKYTNFDAAVKLITDEWYSDYFYKVDLPVTKYTVSVNKPEGYNSVRISAEVKCDKTKARYICYSSNLTYHFDFDEGNGGATYDAVTTKQALVYYVLGDTSAMSCEWFIEAANDRNGRLSSYKPVNIPLNITAESANTLKDLILSEREEDSPINDVDYYNGVIRNLNDYYYDNGYAGTPTNLRFKTSGALVWYLYDVDVESNGKIINKITAPVFPTTQYYYDPYVYEYEYYLSPAAKWASFGKLEVRINSEYYMVEPPEGFEKCDGGYKAEFSSLPKGELTFKMSTAEKPHVKNSSRGVAIAFLVILCFICIGVPLIVFMPFIVKAVKKRRAERELDFSSRRD